jgi:RimJ/RimL family protein N-acetyltransferase
LRAELESHAALAAELGADVPPSWPPELYDVDAVRYTLGWLDANPSDAAWGLYYLMEIPPAEEGRPSARPLLVGVGGYKGAPDASGSVEIGYGVVPESRRRGYAREAVDGLLARAFADPRVARVLAHTLPELAPSIAVLHSAGFAFAGAGSDPHEPTAVQYVLTRESYRQSPVKRHRASFADA